MNDDHAADNQLIARAFGHPDAVDAVMTGLDDTAGFWNYTLDGVVRRLDVPWSVRISERAEIRREVVVVYDAACARLGVEPRPH
nr:DUF2470 domain-containing protein [Terrimesophilobacter mesophilus]